MTRVKEALKRGDASTRRDALGEETLRERWCESACVEELGAAAAAAVGGGGAWLAYLGKIWVLLESCTDNHEAARDLEQSEHRKPASQLAPSG